MLTITLTISQGSIYVDEELMVWRRCIGRTLTTLRRRTENSTSTGDWSTDKSAFSANRCLIARSSMSTGGWDGNNPTVDDHDVLLLLTSEQFDDARWRRRYARYRCPAKKLMASTVQKATATAASEIRSRQTAVVVLPAEVRRDLWASAKHNTETQPHGGTRTINVIDKIKRLEQCIVLHIKPINIILQLQSADIKSLRKIIA